MTEGLLFHNIDVTDGSGCPGGIKCDGHTIEFLGRRPDDPDVRTARDAALEFLDQIGLVPTPDAIDQLVEVFVPCLAIICSRGYSPDGATWRASGWRALLADIRKKFARLWFHSWKHGRYDRDSAIDMINYAGFYIRLQNQGEPWGEWGEPE